MPVSILRRYALVLLVVVFVWIPKADAATLEQLQAIIEQQQKQLEAQAKVLNDLQSQMKQMQENAANANASATPAGAQSANSSTVSSTDDKINLSISGQVNRAVNYVNDGQDSDIYHVDNDASSTRIRAVGEGRVNEDVKIGAKIEFEVESNSSNDVSQSNKSAGTATFKDRVLEAYFDTSAGKVSIGQGSTASDGTSEVDLSRTTVIAYSSTASIGGGLLFRESASGGLTTTAVKNAFSNLDGLGRDDRLRYDSPSFNGFKLSGSLISDEKWDLAARWGGKFSSFDVAAAFGYADPSSTTTDYRLSTSVSMLHRPTGLNVTGALGYDEHNNRDNSKFWYLKGGWIVNPFDFGDTAFSIDVSETEGLPSEKDKGLTFGAYVVQHLADYGTEFYGGVRNYDLDVSSDPSVDDILVGTIGTRIKF